jgi:hypothetical protein
VFDLRELALVSEMCDSSVKGVEGADTLDRGRKLIVSTLHPVVSFKQLTSESNRHSCTIYGCVHTLPHEFIGSGLPVLEWKRTLIVFVEEKGLYVSIIVANLGNDEIFLQP